MSLTITENIFNCLKKINNYNLPYYEFDLVLSGGGVSGFYYAGTFEIIKFLEKSNKIKINKIYATSVGILASIFYLCDFTSIKWMDVYNTAMENNTKNFHQNVMDVLTNIIPKNAHELCTNKLHIVLSRFTLFGSKKEVFNVFNTFDELILIVSASLNVPFLLSKHYMGIKIGKYYYYDGLFSCNTPILYDSPYPQLVMKTHRIEYPFKNIFKINDRCIELLIIRGFIETDKFLNKEVDNKLPFSWIDKNLKKKEKKNKTFYIINILTIGFLIYYKFKNNKN